MRKKYSDPLMFPAILLSGGMNVDPSPNGAYGGDDDWEDEDGGNKSAFMVNNSAATKAVEPLTIENPVEESVNSSESVTGESSEAGSDAASSPMELAPVIDDLVSGADASSGAAE